MPTPANFKVINGAKGVQIQPAKYGRTESGWYTELTWVGSRQAIQTIIPFCLQSQAIFHIEESPSGASTKLIARFATAVASGGVGTSSAESPENNWQYFANVIEKAVLESDLAVVNALDAEDKQVIVTALANPGPFDPDLTGDALSLYHLMRDGVTSIRTMQPILRHTQTVSQLWTIPASTANVGTVLTTDALLRIEQPPAGLLITLPTFASSRADLAYGWFKHFPSIRISALQKVQIEQEWEYGLWPPLLYTFVE